MVLAPVVGLVLAVPAAAVAGVAQRAGADLLAAVLAVAVLALLTRGLHLDGLVDTVDGLASYRPREQALAVMRSPEVGPLGLAALVLVLLTQVAALHACLADGRGAAAVVTAVVAGRLAVSLACTRGVPAASPTGLGATVAGTVGPAAAAVLLPAVLLAAVVPGLVDQDVPAWLGPAAVAAALAAAGLVLRHAVRRLGGVSGDVLGCLLEAATAAALVAFALL
jgi:adenosylcobinamide-GDP ribazoletransferase